MFCILTASRFLILFVLAREHRLTPQERQRNTWRTSTKSGSIRAKRRFIRRRYQVSSPSFIDVRA